MTVRVIAEAGACHQNSVTTAIELVHAAKAAGCYGIKFQLYKADRLAAPGAPKYWGDSLDTADQNEAFHLSDHMPYSAWATVKEVADRIGIEFLATPFDDEALDVLVGMGCRYVKIASGDITNLALLERIAATGLTPILSTGASTAHEIEEAYRALAIERGMDVILLACTLTYPCPPEDANLARIHTLQRRFPHATIGYSDHTTSASTSLPAAALGAAVLEKHFTLDQSQGTVPDHAMALNPRQMAEYVRYAWRGATMRGLGRLEPLVSEQAARDGARRSVHAARTIDPGQVICPDDLILLRPGTGLDPSRLPALIGREWVGSGRLRPGDIVPGLYVRQSGTADAPAPTSGASGPVGY